MKVLYKGALSYPMDSRGSFTIILQRSKLHNFFFNVSPSYNAVYKSNILIGGKILNEVKYDNFHNGWLTLCRNPKATMADADITKIPHAACEVPFISFKSQ